MNAIRTSAIALLMLLAAVTLTSPPPASAQQGPVTAIDILLEPTRR